MTTVIHTCLRPFQFSVMPLYSLFGEAGCGIYYSKHSTEDTDATWHDPACHAQRLPLSLSKKKRKKRRHFSGQPWRVGDAAVGRGTSGQTTTESGRRPCSCLNCSSWRLAEKTGRGFQLNRPSGPLDHIASQWTELNRRRAVSRDF